MDSYRKSSDDLLAAGTSENETDDKAAIMPIELTNSTGTYLDDLNEDCLLEIFSCNLLSLMDLCSLAETCKKFKQITQRVFPKDYSITSRHSDYSITSRHSGYEFRSTKYRTAKISLPTVERIFKHLGLHLSKLTINSNCQDDVNLITKYGGDVNLKSLEVLGSERLDDDVIKDWNLKFGMRLQRLAVKGGTSVCVSILKCTFPNLKRFTWLTCFETGWENYSGILNEFIRRHRHHLESICIIGHNVVSKNFLLVVGSNCKKLKELTLRFLPIPRQVPDFSFSHSTVGSLAKLKTLAIDFAYINVQQYISLLNAVESLETMKIFKVRSEEVALPIFDALSKQQNLSELHLENCRWSIIPWKNLVQLREVYLREYGDTIDQSNHAAFVDIVRQLINLEELRFKYHCAVSTRFNDFHLREGDYFEICQLVEQREHVLTIKCYFRFRLKENCDKNQNVKLINWYDD